jgi:competence ComEA-like helix-hairpin-helix protein
LRTAQNIIDYRIKVGSFKSNDELLDVKGVGKAKFEKIKSIITVK